MKKYHYTYRISNKETGMHYYGDRSSDCHPTEDLGKQYFSSFCEDWFKLDQIENPQNYKYKILKIFETRKEAKALEIKLHQKFDVRNHPKFINLANQTSVGFMTTPEIIEKGLITKLQKYGSSSYNNPEKIREKIKNRTKDEQNKINEKMVATRKAKGTYETGGKKSIETRMNTVDANGKTILDIALEKGEETKLAKYGSKFYNNPTKISETKRNKPEEYKRALSEKLSELRTSKTDGQLSLMEKLTIAAKEKDSDPENRKDRIAKGMHTKEKNGSYAMTVKNGKITKLKNGTIFTYIIFDNTDQNIFSGTLDQLREWCIVNNGSWYAFEESARKGGLHLYHYRGPLKYRHLRGYRCIRTKG